MAVQSTQDRYAVSASTGAGLDALAPRHHDVLLLVGRVALGIIFVLSGWGKLMGLSAFSASLAGRGVPAAELWAVIGAAVEFLGGAMIVLGLATRYAAVLMILFVIVATGISHRFWEYADPQQFRMQQVNFMKNLAIIGGFVVMLAVGGGRLALEAAWRHRRP